MPNSRHRSTAVAVEHLKVDMSSSHSRNSSHYHPSPLPTRSTRDLSINNTIEQRPEKEFEPVRIETVTEKDFSSQSYQERLSNYTSSMGKKSSKDGSGRRRPRDPESDEIVQLLALQSYHLPGNGWWQDWWQYMFNNHPVFGICCHHKLHPIGAKTRIVALIGTVLFGLALTNMFYLFYLWNPEFDRVVARYVSESGETTVVLTTGMLLLWTLGGGIHCAFNLTMWHIAACACCRNGGFCEAYACCPSLGKQMLRIFVVGVLAMSIMIVLLRVAINEQKENIYEAEKGINIHIDDNIGLDIQNASEFSFVIAYLVEMTLAFFVYFPIGGTMLFSGLLACFYKIPILGGRPYEVYSEEKRKTDQAGVAGVLRNTDNDGSDVEQGPKNSIEVRIT
ncbi:hypothetical protein IV203_031878 [Nitzschia inconspicua]|uniref:Uncharacterized protein n=1 Tax=Nitzschia inconspicua TaxID=303405 RepID=A0A9K3LWL1_9STRA|nr:hypothetical protein IV203_031878 [Nitzschia inconspicua]